MHKIIFASTICFYLLTKIRQEAFLSGENE